jgi:hypothetical protein
VSEPVILNIIAIDLSLQRSTQAFLDEQSIPR